MLQRTPESLARPDTLVRSDGAAKALIRDALAKHPGRVALVSSFGADSIVLLHMASQIDPSIPVIFIDTGRHFRETISYVDEVEALLGLKDLRRIGPSVEDVVRLDPANQRATYDPDGCCAFRKTEPLERALKPFGAWISGRKRFQASTRAAIAPVEQDGAHIKYNPLADWTPAEINVYRSAYDLPDHPLVARGYLSIGCAPCTTIVKPGEDPRSGRWRGFEKVECGIHIGGKAGNFRGDGI